MLELIKAQLQSGVPFASFVGINIDFLDAETAIASLPAKPELTNHIATVHAGAMFTLAEAASGAAMAAALAPMLMHTRPVAAQARVRYLKPATGDLTASARASRTSTDLLSSLQSDGVVRFDVDVMISDANGANVAEVTVEWHVRTNVGIS
mgnify:CR=1 FL=1